MIQIRLSTIKPKLTTGPLVSVLIPARNEENNIRRCAESLLNQTYENYEILIIDDNSTDRTREILQELAAENKRVRVFRGKPLPEGWFGKPFALQQLLEFAEGDILLFTDADTVHSDTSISWAVTNMEHSNADLVSGYVGQQLRSFGEITAVPVMFFLTGFVIPMFLNKYIKNGAFSAAIGQYIVMKKSVFKDIGGYEAIRKKTTEDVYLSRYVKDKGYSTVFLDISAQVSCRMYKGYVASIQGIGKNVFDFMGKKSFVLLLVAVAILLFFVAPFPLMFILMRFNDPFVWHCIFVNILFTITWITMYAGRHIPWYYAFLWPLMYVNLIIMVLWSWVRTISGKGFMWKGRVVN
jgi:chlorobactene glucosyltransferase